MARHLAISFFLLAACSGDYCDLERVAECIDCGPGEARHVLVLRGDGSTSIDRTSDGTVCATCDSVLFFDAAFETRQRLSFDVPSAWRLASQVAAGGDTIYVLQSDSGEPLGESEDDPLPVRTLLALTADGSERWRKDLGASRDRFSLSAGPEGPYVSSVQHATAPVQIVALDADGNERWRGGGFDLLAPDGTGGAFTVLDGFSIGTAAVEARIASRDGAGAQRWSRMWKTSGNVEQNLAGLFIDHAAAGTGGEMAVVGTFTGSTIDFGDRILQRQSTGSMFVAQLDAEGATKWAISIGAEVQRPRVAVVRDQVIFGGEYTGAGAALGLPDADEFDSFVAIVDATGIVRSTLLGGRGFQTFDDLHAGPEGTVSVMLTNTGGDGTAGQLRIGSKTFAPGESDDNRTYLINLVP